jgi:hypothetical protein
MNINYIDVLFSFNSKLHDGKNYISAENKVIFYI